MAKAESVVSAKPADIVHEVDRFTYEGNNFPWWMLVIWIGFITFMTYYSIRYLVPNLTKWVEKPPVSKFVP